MSDVERPTHSRAGSGFGTFLIRSNECRVREFVFRLSAVVVAIYIMLAPVPTRAHGDIASMIDRWYGQWTLGVPMEFEGVNEVPTKALEATVHLVRLLTNAPIARAEFALHTLPHVLDERPLDVVVLEALQADDAALRSGAAHAIGVLFDESLVPDLLTHLQYEGNYSSLQLLAVGRTTRALLAPGNVLADDAVRALATVLADEESVVRHQAVQALTALIGQNGLESALSKAVQGSQLPLSEIAVWAVQSVGVEQVDPTLAWLRLIDHWAQVGDVHVVPGIAMLLTHPVLQVSLQAADLIHRIIQPGTLAEALVVSLEHENATVRHGAARALHELATGYDPVVAARIGNVQISADDTMSALARRLTDPAVDVRRAALQAMEQWGSTVPTGARPMLERLGRSENEPADVRAVALRLLATIDPESLDINEWDVQSMYALRAVFERGADGYHTYRIPAAITSPAGTLLVFAEGRRHSQSDTGDIDLVLKRSFDYGATWQPLQVVWDSGPNTSGNPTPVVDHDTGRIWLFMTHNFGADTQAQIYNGTSQGVRTMWVTYSDDDGLTWSPPENVSAAVQPPGTRWDATGPGVGIQLQHGPNKGRLVIPAIGRIIYSDDHGLTWVQGGRIEGTSESQVVELSDGRLLRNDRAVARTVPNRRPLAYSSDQGETWSTVQYARELITTYSQGSTIKYDAANGNDSRTLLFSNPATAANVDQVTGAKGHGARVNMTVRVSHDDGHSWPISKTVHAGPSGYSSLVRLPDGTIGLTFEGGRNHTYETIYFIRFSLEWLAE